MISIQVFLSGLFLIGTLLWVRTAAERCIDSDFREWRFRPSGGGARTQAGQSAIHH